MNAFYDEYSLDQNIIQYHNNKTKTQKINISQKFKKINIEIGFGNGEFLIKSAISRPNELFIGVEVYLNGIIKVLKTILNLKIKNIILSNVNGYYFLEAMPLKSVDKIFIINPDPWIKKRHNKRRLITYEVIKLLTNVVKSKYSIYITTDSVDYLRNIENLLSENKQSFGTYDLRAMSNNEQLFAISKYQRRALEKGGKIYQLVF